jgi:ferredoxin--NADP+ reductase
VTNLPPAPSAPAPLRIAVVGSGPAGLFTVDEVLRKRPGTQVKIYERLPQPFGLVRYGVAPDHPHTRRATRMLDAILAKPGVTLHLNTQIDRDLTLDALRAQHDAVLLATGAPQDRALGLPGEHRPGVWPSLAFAGWVNGHPDFADRGPLPDTDTAIILGHGNVALDVARLLARSAEQLAATDIAPAARDALAGHTIRRILLVGRRGPAQAAFGLAELEEVAALPDWHVSAEPAAFPLSAVDTAELAQADDRARGVCALLETLAAAGAESPSAPRIEFLFHRAPVEVTGSDSAAGVRFERTRLEGAPGQQRAVGYGQFDAQVAGLVVCAAGHVGQPLAGAPFDGSRGVIPNVAGRVVENGAPVRGLYVVGWIKRGARGLIGHNRRDAMETAAALLADFPA